MESPKDFNEKMLIHVVTGTYLVTSSPSSNPGELVMLGNKYPLKNQEGVQGHLWDLIVADRARELYWIRSKNVYEKKHWMHLQSSPNPLQDGEVAYLKVQKFDDNQNRSNKDLQLWKLTKIQNERDTYAIHPHLYPECALGLQYNLCVGSKYVIPHHTWGGPTFHHYWRLSDPPAMIGN
jgi:hypothetical protein